MKKKPAAPVKKTTAATKSAAAKAKKTPPARAASKKAAPAKPAKSAEKPGKPTEKKTLKAAALKASTKPAPKPAKPEAKPTAKKPAAAAPAVKAAPPAKATAKKKSEAPAKAPPKEAPRKKGAEKAAVTTAKESKEAKKALKKNQAVAVAKGEGKAESGVKARSHHLMKILALREARKIKKPEDLHGASATTTKSAKAAAVVAPEPVKKKKKVIRKSPYGKADLKELRKLLSDERERLLRDLRSLDDLADSNKETTHATFSSHQADAASDSASLESTFIQRRMEEERFAWVTEALVKLDKGTYGLCDLCADEPAGLCGTCPYIPIERLRAKPHAKMCVPLRAQLEKRNRK